MMREHEGSLTATKWTRTRSAIKIRTRRAGGFSIVELMVGMVVGLLAMLVIMESFALFEGQKRTTTSGATAVENGLLGNFMIERDMRMAGFGINNAGCTTIRLYTAGLGLITLSGRAVTITQDTPTAGTDQVEVVYSASPFGSIPATVQYAMPTSSAQVRVDNGIGFQQGDLVLISESPKDCSVIQMSQNGQQLGMANLTGPGTQWDLQHNPGGVYVFNPPGGMNIFPVGGYNTGAKASNLGALIYHRYYVQNGNLMVDEMRTSGVGAGTFTTQTLVNGIVALRAEYGRDTGADGVLDVFDTTAPASNSQLVAMRIGLLARSGNYEKDVVSAATVPLWNGGPTVTLASDDQHYRYKAFSTIVPLRNIIWNN
jgi:type IV pilus assembly protein PilW